MRLLILVPYPEAKGPMPRIVALLVEGLRGRGLEVDTDPWGGRGTASGPAARVRQALGDIRRIRALIRRRRPEVVLVQTAFDWKCLSRDLALALAIRGRRRRVVLQFHGSRTDKLVTAGQRPFKLATRLLLRATDGVLVLSTEEQRLLQRFEPSGRYYPVTNPFLPPPEAAAAANGGASARPPTLLFAGRLLLEKGILDVLDAFRLLQERMPSRLVVAGDGPMAEELRRRVSEYELGDRVTLAGRLSPERLFELYHQSDLFILPTYATEGFPTSISEAMSAGLPIVATQTRGIADHLEAETNCLFVPPRDPAALARACERLLADPGLRGSMARANREKVQSFAPDRVVDAYIAALEEIAAG